MHLCKAATIDKATGNFSHMFFLCLFRVCPFLFDRDLLFYFLFLNPKSTVLRIENSLLWYLQMSC
jgi:hypothetical protein